MRRYIVIAGGKFMDLAGDWRSEYPDARQFKNLQAARRAVDNHKPPLAEFAIYEVEEYKRGGIVTVATAEETDEALGVLRAMRVYVEQVGGRDHSAPVSYQGSLVHGFVLVVLTHQKGVTCAFNIDTNDLIEAITSLAFSLGRRSGFSLAAALLESAAQICRERASAPLPARSSPNVQS